MPEEPRIGIPNKIIVTMRVSMDLAQAPELVKAVEKDRMTRKEVIQSLTEWVSEFKRDLEELPGVHVSIEVEEVI